MCVFHSGEILHELAETKITLQCPICGVVKNDFKKLLYHLKLLHEHTANFSVACHVCSSLFTRVRHFFRKHGLTCSEACSEFENHADDNVYRILDVDNEDLTIKPDMSIDILCSELKTHVNLLLLKLQEMHVLPHAIQDSVSRGASFVVDYLWCNVSDIIKNMLNSLNLEIEKNSDLNMLLGNKELFQQIFADASQHKLEKFSREKLKLVDPTEIILKAPNSSTDSSLPKFTFHYVSVLETLKNLLCNTAVLHYIMSETEDCKTGTGLKRYSGYTDGEIYAKHALFSRHRICLRLHFYTDEFEVANPLGSKKGKHKQVAFYFTIGNLPARFNSQLSHIHLCLLAKYSLLQKMGFSYNDILQPLINDLKILEQDGIPVIVNGYELRIYGGVATISSDNLSAHGLAGFSQSFSSGRGCRSCMIMHDHLSLKSAEADCQLRTSQMHCYHVKAVMSNSNIAKSTYGVTGPCPFDVLHYFSTTEVFCPDLMHDFLEGTVPLLLRLILHSFVHDSKYFSATFINDKLDKFRFGQNDRKAKPVHIPVHIFRSPVENSLPGKAIEKWCLFRILPFLVGDLIPAND